MLKEITLTPVDLTEHYILRNAVAEGEMPDGTKFVVDTAMNGDTIINCNGRQWGIKLQDILHEVLPMMLDLE